MGMIRKNDAETIMDLCIFLSSTLIDLASARAKISDLLTVLPADLVSMESFGSDEKQPVEVCLARVRQANLFVGIYAERYGTIDSATGKSITELEYREAVAQLEAGRLLGLLVYILHPEAEWRLDLIDRDAERVKALRALKDELATKHTVTFFRDQESLPLSVLRDILRKLGVGPGRVFRPKALRSPVSLERLGGAMGMEHYTERDAIRFRGREADVSAAVELIKKNSLSLLVGDSGIGKTSLLQAGVFPALRKQDWAAAWCRPLEDPDHTIPSMLWNQLMQGPVPQSTIGGILQLIGEAHTPRQIAIAIDQFEDLIPLLHMPAAAKLRSALAELHNCTPANVHVIVAYRGDTEPKVGPWWQLVSGSDSGLPRYYLGALTTDGAKAAVETIFGASQQVTVDDAQDVLVERLVCDLVVESVESVGISVYPPFLQMVAEGVIKHAEASGQPPSLATYQTSGGAKHLIGSYLSSQLSRLGEHATESRNILITLCNSQRRLRRSVPEIARLSGLGERAVEVRLQELCSLRLVRAVDDEWEVVHDFLARRINEELVAPDEREGRIFREVLSAKAEAFQSTGEFLTLKEHLGVYQHRQRITCSGAEVEALFASFLQGNGPVEYFLQRLDAALPVLWATAALKDATSDEKRIAIRFLTARNESVPFPEIGSAFSKIRFQTEMAGYVRRFSGGIASDQLVRLLSSRGDEVREAAADAVIGRCSKTVDNGLLQRLFRSRHLDIICKVLTSSACEIEVSECRKMIRQRRLRQRVEGYCGLAKAGTAHDFALLSAAAVPASPSDSYAAGYCMAVWAQRERKWKLVQHLIETDGEVGLGALSAVDEPFRGGSIEALFSRLLSTPAYEFHAVRTLTTAIVRLARRRDVRHIRKYFRRGIRSPYDRDLLIAMVTLGSSNDVKRVVNIIAQSKGSVELWNQPRLTRALAAKVSPTLKPWLLSWTQNSEFWAYFPKRPRSRMKVRLTENLYIVKRVVGSLLAGVCDSSDWELLLKLAFHHYWTIQTAAFKTIASFATVRELDVLTKQARAQAGEYEPAAVVDGLCNIDRNLYGPREGAKSFAAAR
jgi:hypothetical protein